MLGFRVRPGSSRKVVLVFHIRSVWREGASTLCMNVDKDDLSV